MATGGTSTGVCDRRKLWGQNSRLEWVKDNEHCPRMQCTMARRDGPVDEDYYNELIPCVQRLYKAAVVKAMEYRETFNSNNKRPDGTIAFTIDFLHRACNREMHGVEIHFYVMEGKHNPCEPDCRCCGMPFMPTNINTSVQMIDKDEMVYLAECFHELCDMYMPFHLLQSL